MLCNAMIAYIAQAMTIIVAIVGDAMNAMIDAIAYRFSHSYRASMCDIVHRACGRMNSCSS